MKPLENKKILFLCPAFRNYDEAINNQLTELGADVTHYSIHPDGLIYDFIMSSNQLRNRLRSQMDIIRKHYFKKIISQIKNEKFDLVFVIKGDSIPKWFLSKLKENNSSARFVLYQWDSLKSYFYASKSDFSKLSTIYDSIYSFDPHDCQTIPGLKYRPLFYLETYRQLANIKTNRISKLDLFSVGGGSPDRFNLMKLIVERYPTLKYHFYLHIVFFSKYIKYIFSPINGFTFYLRNLSQKKIMDELVQCKAVVDVPSSYQDGLTMRTFETLAAHRKLITTNKNILNEPFYHPDNILVVNINDCEIPTDFLQKPFVNVDFDNYTLEAFLTEMLIIEKKNL